MSFNYIHTICIKNDTLHYSKKERKKYNEILSNK